jgi:hypothetical protein
MIEVSIEVGSGDISCEMVIRAGSIRQALSIAGDRHPGRDLRVVFPIKPETFFVERLATSAELVEIPYSVAV